MINSRCKFGDTLALLSRIGFQGFFATIIFKSQFAMLTRIGLLLVLTAMSPSRCCFAQDDSVIVDPIEVVLREINGENTFVVKNAPDVTAAKVQVWPEDANVHTDPAMLGAVEVKDNELFFRPRFPVTAGAKYNVQVSANASLKPDGFFIEIPKGETAPTTIQQVYPTSNVLPENTLKFYVHFSAAMQKGDIYRYLEIREVGGESVELPFLEIEQEFWSRDSKRLTLLLDPGRIKRGLKPRREMGPIFVTGRTYELRVDGDWPDSNGRKIGDDFVKRFRIGPEDHQQPDPTGWQLKVPAENTKQPLVISFSESLDHSMLQSAIKVLGNQANLVAGRIEVAKNEAQWSLTPEALWQPGSYTIEINNRLEDNAGNSIEKQFDVELVDKSRSITSPPSTKLTFEVKQRR